MRLRRLWLTDVRGYSSVDLSFGDGLTVVTGANGAGKTNLLEAIGFLSQMRSFRGAPTEAMVRVGADQAVIRAETEDGERQILIEIELRSSGRSRAQVNRQRVTRRADLLDVFRVSVFTPDDLALVKGGPVERRRLLDDAVALLRPADDGLRQDLERIVRQRNTLLKQARGRLTDEVAVTLDVWDTKLARVGEQLRQRRVAVVDRLGPPVRHAYQRLAGDETEVDLAYVPSWNGALAEALVAARDTDVRRRQTTVGPHRDELDVRVSSLPARTHASQGEQRSLSLALRLAVHLVATEQVGSPPVLLLDDVFSELDAARSRALVDQLPDGQAFLTTASEVPDDLPVKRRLRIVDGAVEDEPETPPSRGGRVA